MYSFMNEISKAYYHILPKNIATSSDQRKVEIGYKDAVSSRHIDKCNNCFNAQIYVGTVQHDYTILREQYKLVY